MQNAERRKHRESADVSATRDGCRKPSRTQNMRALLKFSGILGLVLMGTASLGGAKAQAQGFGLGIATPGLSIGVGSGYYGYGPGYGVGYPGAYYGAYPYVAPPIVVPAPVIVQRPIYGGGYGYRGYRPYHGGYGHGGYGHGGYPHHRR
jgi:hypothetical protein